MNWKLGDYGWRFSGLTEDQCKTACYILGGCVELMIASNGPCMPAKRKCWGTQLGTGRKFYAEPWPARRALYDENTDYDFRSSLGTKTDLSAFEPPRSCQNYTENCDQYYIQDGLYTKPCVDGGGPTCVPGEPQDCSPLKPVDGSWAPSDAGSYWCNMHNEDDYSIDDGKEIADYYNRSWTYTDTDGSEVVQGGSANWKLGSHGWRFCGLTLAQCQAACSTMGDCAELMVTSNGCCLPAKSRCNGTDETDGEKFDFSPTGYCRKSQCTTMYKYFEDRETRIGAPSWAVVHIKDSSCVINPDTLVIKELKVSEFVPSDAYDPELYTYNGYDGG